MIDEEALPDFLNEAGDLVEVLQNGLLALENASAEERAETVQNLFRAAHSIKGAAGMVGLSRTAELTHALEEVLDAIRAGRSTVNVDIIDALFAGADCLTTLVAAIANGEGETVETEDVTEVLKAVLPHDSGKNSAPASTLPVSPEVRALLSEMEDLNLFVAEHAGRKVFEGRLRVASLAASAIDPAAARRRLESLGEIVALVRLDLPGPVEAATWAEPAAELGLLLATEKDATSLRAAAPWIGELRLLTAAAGDHDSAGEGVDPQDAVGGGTAASPSAQETNKYLDLFIEESAEEIEGLVTSLLVLEESASPEAVREAFRFAHRLKGGAAAMGFRHLADLCHRLEDLLDAIRAGQIETTPVIVSLLLEASDAIRALLEAIRGGGSEASDFAALETRFAEILGEGKDAGLPNAASGGTAASPSGARGPRGRGPSTGNDQGQDETKSGTSASPSVFEWNLSEFEHAGVTNAFEVGTPLREIEVALQPVAPLRGIRAELVLTNLETLGEIIAVRPPRREIASDEPDRLQVLLASSAPEEDLRRAANVDQVDSIVFRNYERRGEKTPPKSSIPPDSGNAPSPATAENRRDACSTNAGSRAGVPPVPPNGNMQESVVSPGATTAPPSAPEKTSPAASRQPQSIRVDLEKLDALMNMAGELVVIRARFQRHADFLSQGLGMKEILWSAEDLARRAEELCSPDLAAALRQHLEKLHGLRDLRTVSAELELTAQQLLRVSTALQNGVMSARMLPVAQVFNRFPRLVRDLSRQFGKEVGLEVSGEETELDKRVIDELGDPLTHLIRNALDHGIESPEERSAAGKPVAAILELSAFREGSMVCIRIRDDGRGINRARVLSKARERGLVAVEKTLADEEILKLIFQPGFSTAAVVSDVSGRGVGMDIVKSRIEELKGSIEIASTEGAGTTVTLRIPLTLSILKVLLVEDAGVTLAVPVEQITEITRLGADAVKTVEGRPVSVIRNQVLPVLDLAPSLGLADRAETSSRPFALVARAHPTSVVFRVERLLGEEEVVVKGLPDEMAHVEGLSGVTILGDGRVALIMDAAGRATQIARRLREGA